MQIIEINEEIGLNQAVIFPDYSENWYSSGSSDPNSEFVQRRKSDLQVSFFLLTVSWKSLVYLHISLCCKDVFL
jgi:hypothetical protein